jgi:hypothetical protein
MVRKSVHSKTVRTQLFVTSRIFVVKQNGFHVFNAERHLKIIAASRY